MRVAGAVLSLLPLPLLAGCERSPGPPVALKSFTLHDVQGYHGGQAIWAAEDRTAFVQVVDQRPSGLWEKLYQTTLTADQWAEVERLVGAHHLLSAKMRQRKGLPDEAHPIIVVVPQDGATVKLLKLDGDQNPDFDPVYAYLLGLCREEGDLVREGPFEWEWRPEGFDKPW